MASFAICATCNFDTRRAGANNFMTDSFTFPDIGMGICSFSMKSFDLYCLNFSRVFFRQSVPSHMVWERKIALSTFGFRTCFQMLDHCGNYMGLLQKDVHLLSTDSFLPLSSQRWHSFPCDSWFLKFVVLII